MDLSNVYGFNIILIVANTIIALVIALILGKLHEVIHAIRAKQLGYKVNKISLWKNETDIDIKEDDPNFKKIARTPYYVMFPIGFLFIIIGYYMWTVRNPFYFGVIIGGIAIIFLHILSLRYEGKDVNRTMFKMQKEQSKVLDKER